MPRKTKKQIEGERDRAWAALIWMTGSFNPDFEPKGKARKGWLKIVRPVLAEIE